MSDDSISRHAVNAIIDALFQNKNHPIIISPIVLHAFRQIQNLPSVNNWIPCSERLPENEGIFLVSSDDGHVATLRYDEEDKIWFGVIHFGEDEEIYNITNVFAWQPLPEPWRLENE